MGKEPSRRLRRRTENQVGLDDLLGWDATEPGEPTPAGSRGGFLAKGVVASTFMGVLISLIVMPLIAAAALTLREATDYWNNLPGDLPAQSLPQRSVMLAADGTKIAEFYSENRVLVSLAEVPQVMRDALIAIEDARFYSHPGVDIRGTGRALVNNLITGTTQGGSTLTQQYVKQVLADAATTEEERQAVTSRTSYMRKLREAKLAIETEKRLTKDQILEGYLNIAYFGDGAYGVGTAARHYFNKPVRALTLPEAALLAGLVKNPTGYDPTDNRAAARSRRNLVLGRMRDLDLITAREHRRASRTPVQLDVTSTPNGCHASKYPFFCQYVKQQLEDDPAFGATAAARQQRLFRGGMVIKTTLDPDKQRIAQQAVDQSLGRDHRVAASTVTVQPGTGHVVAMAVNRTFGAPKPGRFDKTEIILPTVPAFQPGSNFKPFTLAAALEQGFDPDTRLSAPAVYAPPGMNYPGSGFQNSGSAATGTFTAAQAVWRSSNTWFVRLQEQVGVLNVAKMAARLGLTSLPLDGPRAITARDASLTLGTYEVSPLEMAASYAAFAASGVHCRPVVITAVTGPDGTDQPVPDPDCHEAIPPSVADTIANIMVGTITGPDPYRTGKDMAFGRPAAGKTGTTQNNAAVWFSGFTPQYATSVAVMDPRGGFAHPLQNFYAGGQFIPRAYGGLVAGPIWKQVMAGIHAGLPIKTFPPPDGVTGYANVVPDVRGMTLPQAWQVLTAAGFEVAVAPNTAPADPLLRSDRVYTTEPGVASRAGLGTTVTVTMTDGSNLRVNLDDQPRSRVRPGPALAAGVVTPSTTPTPGR